MAQGPRGIPDDILREIVSDPDFQKLSEEDQDMALSRFSQESFGGIQPTENLLQRMGKAAMQPFMPDAFGKPGMNQALQMSGMAPYMGARGAQEELLNEIENPIARFGAGVVSDPLSWMGGSAVAKGAGKVAKSVIKPSTVYGEAVSKAPGKVNFLQIISKHSDDPIVKKVLDKAGIVEKYGGRTLGEGGSVSDNLANLTSEQAQNLINDMKVGQTKGFLTGDLVKSDKVNLSKFFGDLSKAQNEALPGMKGAKKLYGFSKGVGKFAKKYGRAAATGVATGAGLGIGGKIGYDIISGGK